VLMAFLKWCCAMIILSIVFFWSWCGAMLLYCALRSTILFYAYRINLGAVYHYVVTVRRWQYGTISTTLHGTPTVTDCVRALSSASATRTVSCWVVVFDVVTVTSLHYGIICTTVHVTAPGTVRDAVLPLSSTVRPLLQGITTAVILCSAFPFTALSVRCGYCWHTVECQRMCFHQPVRQCTLLHCYMKCCCCVLPQVHGWSVWRQPWLFVILFPHAVLHLMDILSLHPIYLNIY
jgi:hypothetical protein